MSKRHLTKQQQARIAALQESRAGVLLRVVAQLGRELEVENEAKERYPAKLRQNLPPIVTGDWVLGNQAQPPIVIEQLMPRTNFIERPSQAGKRKAIAANVDQVLLVLAPLPVASLLMIDRYLVQLNALDLPVILVLNKIDLGLDDLKPMISLYQDLGYPVLTVSTVDHQLGDLSERLALKTSILLGQSGVGKSSLIHALDPALEIRIGDLSQTEQGKHTTTITRLYHVGEAAIIDSPGVYDLASWHLTPEQVRSGFFEFSKFKSECQFHNCTHTHEPKCGIKQAVEAGLIAPSRYQSYSTITNE